MKRNILVLGLCLFALVFAAPQSLASAQNSGETIAASGSSTVGNPDGAKKGSGNRTILTERCDKESGTRLA